MNFPSDLSRLPKWIFLAGDAALLATAWAIGHNAGHPYAGATLWAIVILVVVAVAVGAYPFIADDARRYDQALDDRQKALQVLAGTVATAAEQVSIAATGLQTIAEAAQENFRKSEALTAQLSGHIAEFDRRLGGVKPDAGSDAGGDTRIDAAVKKITRVASALEVTLTKTVEAARTMTPFSVPAVTPAPAADPVEAAPVLATEIVEIKPVLSATDDSAAPIPLPDVAAPETVAPQEQLAEPAPSPPPPRKRAPRKPRVTAPGPVAVPEPPPDTPAPRSEAAAAPLAAEPEPVPAPAPEPPPAPVAEPEADVVPPMSFGLEEEELAEDPADDLAEDLTPPPLMAAPGASALPEEAPPAPEPVAESAAPNEAAAPARTTDGATRLVVTAYIGIGNRLFIRGDGPGLSWDRGVPLTFVSIGKWRWETNDASKPVRFRLFKNDTVECTALGEQAVAPGAQQELSASF